MKGGMLLQEIVKEPLYLERVTKQYLWGTEEWVLSCHEMGPSLICNQGYEGISLQDFAWREKEFPLLIKLIDAKEALSVQVHPGDNYAFVKEGCRGKTEMWYILDHEPGAFLYYGLKYKVTENEIRKRLKNGSILDVCRQVPVKKGEVYFIPPGMLHAIGKGIRLAEVQQNSCITYRVYDYDREDANHNKRQIHVDQAMDVMGFVPAIAGHSPLGLREKREGYSRILLAYCANFVVWSYKVEGRMQLPAAELMGRSVFLSLVIVRGEGAVNGRPVKPGDSIYIPCGCLDVTMEGNMEVLVSVPPEEI